MKTVGDVGFLSSQAPMDGSFTQPQGPHGSSRVPNLAAQLNLDTEYLAPVNLIACTHLHTSAFLM